MKAPCAQPVSRENDCKQNITELQCSRDQASRRPYHLAEDLKFNLQALQTLVKDRLQETLTTLKPHKLPANPAEVLYLFEPRSCLHEL